MVSDLIAVARGLRSVEALERGAPTRFQKVAQRMPVVVWNVCQHCNMTCPHCYIVAGRRPSPIDLSHEEAIRMLDDLIGYGIRVIIFSGGEPLMRDDIFELIAHANARGVSCHLSTNGVLIDAEVAQRLKQCGIRYVGISIDGLASFNDEYRGMDGAFQRALTGIAMSHEVGMSTGLRMTVTQRNYSQTEAMLALAHEHGVGRFYFSHLLDAGRGERMAEEDISPEQSRSLLERLFELADVELEENGAEATPKIVTGGNDSDGVALWLWVRERFGERAAQTVYDLLLRRGGNSAGEGVINIDNRGRVLPDQFWRSAILGDLRQQSFAEVMTHPLLEELRTRSERLTGKCGSCVHKELCRGSHRERALARHGETWASDPACVLTNAEAAAMPGPTHARGAEV